ncbi:hypothetical protein [Streptomyces panaciradicis]|uniref:hypothetical protein n=1 Tax=Streptomyces panaciradicis TaxID=1470261 RepID=UPI0024C1E95F
MSAEEPGPEHTAVRVALWRALHLRADAPPHVVEDEVGLRPSRGEELVVATV